MHSLRIIDQVIPPTLQICILILLKIEKNSYFFQVSIGQRKHNYFLKLKIIDKNYIYLDFMLKKTLYLSHPKFLGQIMTKLVKIRQKKNFKN